MTTDPTPAARSIRSYVYRSGRATAAQRRAIDTEWPRFGLPDAGDLDPRALFPRPGALTVEVGFGSGECLLALAAAHPERNFIGIEVYPPGIGRVLMALAEQRLDNVRLLRGDAADELARLPERSIDLLLLFFPDPWPKKRHHKRRLVQPAFAELAARRLRTNGRWLLATDWPPYAAHMLEVLEANPHLANVHGPGALAERPAQRPPTRFERRGAALGHQVADLAFRRID